MKKTQLLSKNVKTGSKKLQTQQRKTKRSTKSRDSVNAHLLPNQV